MLRTRRVLRGGGMGLVLAACALSLAPPARAQSDADRENAQALYKAGNDARDAGDMKEAAAKYKVAYALVQTPVIAVALGKAQLATGLLIEARQTLLSVDRIPVKLNESALTTAARGEASALAPQIEPRIPAVLLKIARPAGAPAPAVTIDGLAIPEAALDVPRKLDPGPHVAMATNAGQTTEVPFTLVEGESKDLPVAYPAGRGSAPVPVPAATPTAPAVVAPPWPSAPPTSPLPAASSGGSSHTAAWVSLGVGGTGVAVTAIFGALALGDKSTLSTACGSNKSDCPATSQSDISSLHTNALVSDVGLGVAIAGVGLGGVLLLVQRGGGSPRTGAVELRPLLGVGKLGMTGSF